MRQPPPENSEEEARAERLLKKARVDDSVVHYLASVLAAAENEAWLPAATPQLTAPREWVEEHPLCEDVGSDEEASG
eukprot:280990-Prymnesium_polylepis.1